MATRELSRFTHSYLAAELSSGATFLPGATPVPPDLLACAGPDIWGRCPAVLAGAAPPCAGATWTRRDRSPALAWRLTFEPDPTLLRAGLCPAPLLERFVGEVHHARAFLEAAP